MNSGRFTRVVTFMPIAFLYRHRVQIGWALIIAAVALRATLELLPLLRYTSFYFDQANDAFNLSGIPYGHWPALGPPNSFAGYYLPPTYYYLIAPFLLFGLHPALQNLPNALTSLATLPLLALVVYRLANRHWRDSGRSLLLSGAVALWASINWFWYSTSVGEWCPYPIPFFVLSTVLVMDRILDVRDRVGKWREGKYWLLLGLLIGFSLGLHSMMLVLMPIFFTGFAAFAIYRHRYSWPWALAAIAIILLILTPYLADDAARHFQNTSEIAHSLQNTSSGTNTLADRANRMVLYAHSATEAAFVVTDAYRELTFLLLIVCAIGVMTLLRLDRRLACLLLTITGLNLLAASSYTGPIYAQYFLLLGILPTLGAIALIIKPPRQGRILVIILLGIMLMFSSFRGLKNIAHLMKIHYGANRVMSVDDRLHAMSQIPHGGALCTSTPSPEAHLDYIYIKEKMLRRTDLIIRGDCKPGDYYIYHHALVAAEPINADPSRFTLYRQEATYDLLIRK